MQQLTILNTREIKKLRENIIAEFGVFLTKEYAFLRNEKDKIFLVNKDIARLDLKKLRIDRLGLYFAEVKGNQVRLSKEGAQLLVEQAENSQNKNKLKNIVELTKEEVKRYFQGEDLEKDLKDSDQEGENPLIILKFENNILGCAKYKEGKIINFLPKIHRGEVII